MSNTELAKVKAATVAVGVIDRKSLQSDLRPTFIAGSGFLVSPDGYVITAAHVLEKCIEFKEYKGSNDYIVSIFNTFVLGKKLNVKAYPALKAVRGIILPEIKGYQGPRDLDISIIKLSVGSDENSLPFLEIKQPAILNLYSEVVLCGYPAGDLSFSIKGESKISSTRFSPVLQFGRISGFMPLDVSPDPYGIQTDIIGTSGSSGSPIVDKVDGQVIGIAQRVLPSDTIAIINQNKIYGEAKIGLVYGLTNHVITDLPKKTKNFFEKGIKIDITFATTGFDLEFGGFG